MALLLSLALMGLAEEPATAQSITSVQPESGAPGTQVRIYGSGFDTTASNNTVTFGDTEATVDSAKTNVLYAKVPSGESGPVSVEITVSGNTGVAADKFIIVVGGGTAFTDIGAGLPDVNESSVDWGDYDGDGDLDLVLAGSDMTEIYENKGDGNFAAINAGLIGAENSSISWGDYDGDGDLDLAVAGYSSEISDTFTKVYRNEGGGTFTAIDAGLQSAAGGGNTISWGDYDGDGDLDLALAGGDPFTDTKIYRNDGSGSFTVAESLPDGLEISWGDYNRDGKLDLALHVSVNGGSTKIYRNEGNGDFTDIGVSLLGSSFAWGDYDGDGLLDLAASEDTTRGDGGEETLIYHNEGKGTFEAEVFLNRERLGSLSWGDFDGDGNPDLAVAGAVNEDSSVTKIYRNEGGGTFSAVETSLPGVSNGSIAWGDYDGNGDLDLALSGGYIARIYRNEGNRPPVAGADSFWTLKGQALSVSAPGVLKDDSDPDETSISISMTSDVSEGTLTLASDGSFDYTPDAGFKGTDQFMYQVSDGRATDTAMVTIHVNQSITAVQPRSGTPGTSVRIYGAGFSSTPSNNTVTFGGTTASIDSAASNVIYTQVPNGVSGPMQLKVTSGGTTLVSAHRFVAVSGGGTNFEDIGEDFFSGGGPLAWGDYDSDGDQDLAFGWQIYRNEGEGRFTAIEAELDTLDNDPSLAWGDYDGDGDLDIVLAGATGTFKDPMTKIYRNEGNGKFVAIGAGLAGVREGSLKWNDFDRDGDLDLAVFGSGIAKIYRNEGNGTFRAIDAGLTGVYSGSVSWGDYNGDGAPDLAVSGDKTQGEDGGETTTIYRNEGGGSFTAIDAGLTGVTLGTVSWEDFDGDGDLDLAIAGESGSFDPVTKIYRNEGGGNFTAIGAGLTGVYSDASLSWGDVDGDGNPDLALAGTNSADSSVTKIYQNDGDGFTEVGAGLPGVSGFQTTTVAWGDVDQSGTLDLALTGDGSPVRIYQNVGGGGGSSLSAPSGLQASATDGPAVDLSWSGIDDPDALQRYRLYRDTASITGSPSALSPFDSTEAGTTSFTDEPDPGQTYYYRVTAVDTAGAESGFSGEASAFLYPSEVTASASRTFGGATDSTGYRLVALPGRADTPIGDAVSGEAGAQWQAYYDDGSDSDFLVEFDGSDTFTFQQGNGFWLTATSEWTFDQAISTVDLRGDSATAIAVREGWNVVSNPFDKDVDWAAVEAATGADLQPIWAFGGAFDSTATFASAATGEAYYFFNDESSRDSLVIPYPGAPGSKAVPKAAEDAPAMLAVSASAEGPSSTVKVGLSEDETGSESIVAPPGRFEPVSLRIEASGADATRSGLLMAERRPAEGGGRTFRLRLTSQVEGPVALTADHLDAIEGQSVALLHPSGGTTHDLREKSSVEIEPGGEAVELQLAVGTEGYVKDQKEQVLPEEVRLTTYPNPVRRQGTVEYALPEASKVTLRVYDVLGRQVATLEQGRKEAGRHTVRLKTDGLASGVYFGRLRAAGQTLTQKITVVR